MVYGAVSSQLYKKWVLLFGSLYFYSVWSIPCTALLIASIVINYCACQAMVAAVAAADAIAQKRLLLMSLVINLSILFCFKYYNFFSMGLAQPLGISLPTFELLLPMGISFYTFENLSCTIDVYRGDVDREQFLKKHSLLDYSLYISFFPHLVAGPIMRAADLMPQFSQKADMTGQIILEGCCLACWGLIKKVFLAAPLGEIVNSVYGEPTLYSGAALLLATYAFALQIYFDFSGYTDVARGVGKALGFDIPENFNAPYLAASLRDFWCRWHISLSAWLKDYLYIPLGGSRHGLRRTGLNLMATMLLGGLWHGAAWTFIVWGGLHGAFLVAERLLADITFLPDPKFSLLKHGMGILTTFHAVCLSWVFFRAEDLSQAITIVTRIAVWSPGETTQLWPLYVLGGLLVGQLAIKKLDWVKLVFSHPTLRRWFASASIVLLVIALSGSETAEFIYFQF